MVADQTDHCVEYHSRDHVLNLFIEPLAHRILWGGWNWLWFLYAGSYLLLVVSLAVINVVGVGVIYRWRSRGRNSFKHI